MTPVSICVPSVRAETVVRTIDAIRRQEHESWELIVVAQGPPGDVDQVVANAQMSDARVRLVRTSERGVSRARNLGAQRAQHDVIAFTDDDCEPEPQWISGLVRALASEPGIDVAAGSLVSPQRTGRGPWFCPEQSQVDATLRPTADRQEFPEGTGFVSANFAIRRSALDAIHGFDELIGAGASSPFPAGEDTDLWIRLIRAGTAVRFTSQAPVNHTFGARSGLRDTLTMRYRYAAGEGTAAAKMQLGSGDAGEWRQAMSDQGLRAPLREHRPWRLPLSLARLAAFELTYRRCIRDCELDERGHLRWRHDRQQG